MFLFTDGHVAQESFLELINNMLTSGMVPALFPDDEKEAIIGQVHVHIDIYSLYIHVYVYAHVYIHIHIHTCIYIYMHMYIYIYTYMYMYVYNCTCRFMMRSLKQVCPLQGRVVGLIS